MLPRYVSHVLLLLACCKLAEQNWLPAAACRGWQGCWPQVSVGTADERRAATGLTSRLAFLAETFLAEVGCGFQGKGDPACFTVGAPRRPEGDKFDPIPAWGSVSCLQFNYGPLLGCTRALSPGPRVRGRCSPRDAPVAQSSKCWSCT